ncbi:MAG TPA: class I SAM-dependent methyltransferase [Roseomonas sp.]|jgi:SAM-dependent methyltransferase
MPDDTATAVRAIQTPASVDDVDEAGYLRANPDVARAGMRARDHFVRHGQQEGRVQLINAAAIADIRQRKIDNLRFRVRPTVSARGEAPSFLSPEVTAEFDIPDAPPVSSNEYGADLIETIGSNPGKLFLDVGAGVRQFYFPNVVNTEIYPSHTTDIVCVGENLPFEDEQFDYVFAFAVLEHTRRPWDVAAEICRVLKPGGTVMIDYPFLQSVHGFPHHYFNATPQGNRSLFEDACDIVSLSVKNNQTAIHSIYWTLAMWRAGLSPQDAAAFDQVTIGRLLAHPPSQQQLEEPYCTGLPQETQMLIGAGSTLVGIKRPAGAPKRPSIAETLRAENATLRHEVGLLRSSTSWRLTAPIRAVLDRLRGAAGRKA